MHHIVDWARVQEHTFDNLICLCAVDHHRATVGEIDRLAMLQYKANLAVLNNRYGDLERRVLELFSQHPESDYVDLPGGSELLMWYLVKDGLVTKERSPNNYLNVGGYTGLDAYVLTGAGRDFIARWVEARSLE